MRRPCSNRDARTLPENYTYIVGVSYRRVGRVYTMALDFLFNILLLYSGDVYGIFICLTQKPSGNSLLNMIGVGWSSA